MLGLTLVSGRRHCGFYMCAGSNGVRSGMPKLTIWIIFIPQSPPFPFIMFTCWQHYTACG